jgi:hypothetical protein
MGPGSHINDSGRLEPSKSLPASSPLDERTRPLPTSPPPIEANSSAFSGEELAVVRRAYARQMLAIVGVQDAAIEAAFATAPREAVLGPPPWTASSRFGGARPLLGADPVVLHQDLVVALDPARGFNNPPGAARQAHRGPWPEAGRAHRPCRRRRRLL